jgi:hypothetical protein
MEKKAKEKTKASEWKENFQSHIQSIEWQQIASADARHS